MNYRLRARARAINAQTTAAAAASPPQQGCGGGGDAVMLLFCLRRITPLCAQVENVWAV